MGDPPTTDSAATPVTLPEELPPLQAPVRVRPVWLPWILYVAAAPLFWLMPKQFGPHFAAAGWRAAVGAFVVWTIYAHALLVMSPACGPLAWLIGRTPQQQGWTFWPVATAGEALRAPLAMPAQVIVNYGDSVPRLVRMSRPFAVVVLVPEGAALLMAAGERNRRLFGRALRLALWASTSLIVLAVAMQAMLLPEFWACVVFYWSAWLPLLGLGACGVLLRWMGNAVPSAASRNAQGMPLVAGWRTDVWLPLIANWETDIWL